MLISTADAAAIAAALSGESITYRDQFIQNTNPVTNREEIMFAVLGGTVEADAAIDALVAAGWYSGDQDVDRGYSVTPAGAAWTYVYMPYTETQSLFE